MGIKMMGIRPSNDSRPYVHIYARAKVRMDERANQRMNERGELWIIECIYSGIALANHLETARIVRAHCIARQHRILRRKCGGGALSV